MLSTTVSNVVARVSEAFAIDNETCILPVLTLPLVTKDAHTMILKMEADLRTAQADAYKNSTVIRELDSVIVALQADFREECVKRIKHEMTIEEMDNEISTQEDVNLRLHEEVDRHLEQIEELTGEHADALSNVASLMGRIKGYEADMKGTLKALEDARKALEDARKASVILLEMADTASKDADRALATSKTFRDMLDASGKREDEQYETLMGVRALAQSDMLTDGEKVALILRMVK